MRRLFVLAGVLLLVAGCVQPSEPLSSPSPSTDPNLPDFRPVEEDPVQDEPRTLDAAPKWKQGEWWKIRLTDFTGGSYETVRVVAGQEGDDYLVGMPGDAFSDDLMVLHLPGFGQVSKKNLSWEIHNVRFSPLQFPLTDGATWDTAFEGRPVKAKVFRLSETQARVQLDGTSDHINVTYDATVGEIVKYSDPNYAEYEVVDHGFDYDQLVTVPHMFRLVFNQARYAQVLSPGGGPVAGFNPAPMPSDTIKLDSTYDRVSFVLLTVDLPGFVTGQGANTGYYNIKATGPGSKNYELTVMPGEPSVVVKTFAQDFPGGDWTFTYTGAGPGIMIAEGIAYHIYDIEMPSGKILPSEGEHKHGHH